MKKICAALIGAAAGCSTFENVAGNSSGKGDRAAAPALLRIDGSQAMANLVTAWISGHGPLRVSGNS